MACALLIAPIRLIRILTCCALISGAPSQEIPSQGSEPTLVRVNITTETRGAQNAIEINGKLLTGYDPIIIQALSATGIVLDRSHITIFLGYRWIDIQDRNPRIEISTSEGQKRKGRLVGIDQSNGVAVIRLLNGKLKRTPVCTQCKVEDGITIVVPVGEGPAPSQYRKAQIISVSADQGIPGHGNWIVALNHPFPDIGQPILTTDHSVLGFVASRDPIGMRTIVFPISQLLSSAEKILKTGGDIRAGWLGIFLVDSHPATGRGIIVRRVEPDSPAEEAGLVADDFLLKYNGQEIQDARQFIQLVQGTAIGSKANLDLMRQGNSMTVTALIGARKSRHDHGRLSFNLPGDLGSPFVGTVPEPEPVNPRLLFGLDTMVLTPPLADALRMPGQTGLLVIGVAKQMPADLAGILVGDVIVAIEGQPIVDIPSFASYLQTHIWGSRPAIRILRGGIERVIVVQIPDFER
jgi:S1-C subfamily serine protease